MTQLPDQGFDVQAFLEGRCTDPGAWFGMHPLPGGGFRVRAFLPGATRVSVTHHTGGEPVAEMVRIHEAGLWEAESTEHQPFLHRFRVHGWGEAPLDLEDPYRFGPVLGEMDHWLHAEGCHYRLYKVMGAHPVVREGVSGTAFAVWAPSARRVSVVGSFNGWDGRRHIMRQYGQAGVWELFVPHAGAGDLYKFEILDASDVLLPLKSDPYAFRCEQAPGDASEICGLRSHAWGDEGWMRGRWQQNRREAPVSIYEVHLGSWRRTLDNQCLTYLELARQLPAYAREMGFTHVQFLPVSEHPFYGSWGYQPLGLFAPTSRYGTPEDFKVLVDALHQAGIGVLLDWVPAHFPGDDHGLGWFDGTALYEHEDPRQGRHQDWGTLIYNFGRTEVQNFLIANALYWMDEFHIDGLRVDAVASMLYLDYSRRDGEWVPNRYGGRENLEAISFLRRLNETVYREFPDTLTVAEESTAWPMVSRPTHMGGLGFGFKWNMGWMHDVLRYFGRETFFRRYHQNDLTFAMLYAYTENYVLPLSHDEVVHGKGSLMGRMPGDPWQKAANLRLLLCWQWLHPGKKLLFMGGEFGQFREWNHDQSLDWHLLEDGPFHRGVQSLVRDLNGLLHTLPALHEEDCEPRGFKWIDCSDHANCVLSFIRWDSRGERPVVALFNATAQAHAAYRIGVPRPGRYLERLNSDGMEYGGGGTGNGGAVMAEDIPVHGLPWSVQVQLPPLGVLVLVPEG